MSKKTEIFHTRKKKSILKTIFVWLFIFSLVFVASGAAFYYFFNFKLPDLIFDQTFLLTQVVVDGSILAFYLFVYRVDAQNIALKYSSTEDSHWATKKEIQKSKEFITTTLKDIKNSPDGFLVEAKKRNRSGTNVEITMTTQMHGLIVGTTGAGKSSGYVDQTIQLLAMTKNQPSFIVSDPKGELYENHAKTLQKKGYKVTLLDLRNPYSSSKWNPFSVLQRRIELLILADDCVNDNSKSNFRDGKYYVGTRVFGTKDDVKIYRKILEDEINDNAKDIIYNLCPIKGRDPLWESGSRDLILSVLLCFCEDCRSKKMDLNQLTLNNLFYNFTQYADDIEKIKDYVLTQHNDNLLAKSYGQQVLLAEDKTLMSFKSTLVGYVNKLADKGILTMTSANNIDFSEIDEGAPKAIFLAIPAEKETRYELPRIFVSQAYKELVAKANENKICYDKEIIDRSRATDKKLSRTGTTKFNKIKKSEESKEEKQNRIDIQDRAALEAQKPTTESVSSDEDAIINQENLVMKSSGKMELKRKVYFILDEFGNLPKFENIKKMVAVGRSMGVRFLFVLQDYAQLDDVYGKEESKIIQSNCNVKIYIGTQDEGTLKAFSELCGNRRVAQKSINTNLESNPSSSTSITTLPLISPAELNKLNGEGTPKGQAVVCVHGYSPIHSEFTPSFLMKKIYFPEGICSSVSTQRATNFEEKTLQYDMIKAFNSESKTKKPKYNAAIPVDDTKPSKPKKPSTGGGEQLDSAKDVKGRDYYSESENEEPVQPVKTYYVDTRGEKKAPTPENEGKGEAMDSSAVDLKNPLKMPQYRKQFDTINEQFEIIANSLPPINRSTLNDITSLGDKMFYAKQCNIKEQNKAISMAIKIIDSTVQYLNEKTSFYQDYKAYIKELKNSQSSIEQ